jgi:hypothetical protein
VATLEIGCLGPDVLMTVTLDGGDRVGVTLSADQARHLCNGLGTAIHCSAITYGVDVDE